MMKTQILRKKLQLLLMLLMLYNLYGQQNHTIDMYPKTPDAAAASKFTDIPAGNYTGVSNFSIPIYTITTKGGSIPISLQYTTTGIKVSEIASRVGLGWSLDTGPSLSHQVIGRPDDKELFKKPTLYSVSNLPEACVGWHYSYNDPCGILLSGIGVTSNPSINTPDLVPDIFSYSLLNGSGQFIMDFSGSFGIPRPYNLIKIKPMVTSHVAGMEMTDEKGLIYTFQNFDFDLKHYNSCMGANVPIDTDTTPNYKIKTIKLPNQEIITYTYKVGISSHYITSISEQKNIYNKISTSNAPFETLPASNCKNTTHSNDGPLTEIDFNDGKVLFYYNIDPEGATGSARQDLPGDVYLTRVIVKDKYNHVIKDVSLGYDYFVSPNEDPENYPDAASNYPDVFNRLKLISVKDNLSLGEYKLSYHGDETGKTLPNRLSYSQDFWGVYNGKPNSTGIATVKVKRWDSQNIYDVYLGANKEPDINYGVVGNLKKIQYPNGGYTEITYEADDYKDADAIYGYESHQSEETNLEMPYIEFEILDNGFPIYNQTLTLEDSNCSEDSQEQPTWSTPMWELSKKNASGSYILQKDGFVCTKTENRVDGPGIYKLRVYERAIDGGEIPVPGTGTRTITAKYSWINEYVITNSDVGKTGNIRIKQIESNSIDAGKILRKYTYLDPKTNQTSGKNAGEERFVSLSYNVIGLGPPGVHGAGRSVNQLNRINNPGWQTATVRGKAVGYDYVQEIYESSLNPNENYKKQYKFLNDLYIQHSYNYGSPVNVSWPTLDLERGLMLEEKLYNGNGDSIRVSKMEYDYDSFFNQFATMNYFTPPENMVHRIIAQGLEIKLKKFDVSTSQIKTYHFINQPFDITNIWIKNIKTTTTDYVNNQPVVVTEQTTAYSTNSGQNRHTFPESQTSTVVGSGITSSQSYKYAHDSNNYLKDKNMVSVPLVTETKKTINGVTKVLSKTETVFPMSETEAKTRILNNTNNKDFPLPFEVLSKDLQTSTMEKQINFDFYDNKGNLQQYTTKSGISTAIIWGYNQTQPIAKIEGATYAQVSNLATAIVTASDADASDPTKEGALIIALDSFRTALPGYQITTYTYDPLIGVTSVTPPSGVREIYIYDTANRLQEVRDINGNLLKSNEYHYKP